MPKSACAPPSATRKPVITSSKISTRAVARAFLAQRLEEAGLRQHEVHVAGDRLDDHAGDLAAAFLEERAHLRSVVVVEHQRVRRGVGGHARRAGVAERERAGARLHEQRVGVAVIAAFELDDRDRGR